MQKKSTDDRIEEETVEVFFNGLKSKGFKLVICVPCSLLNGLIAYASQSKDFLFINATSEGEAVAIAVGANLAGHKAIIICQNSGLGNMVNPLSSLAHTFGIPILIIMSWRGNPNKQDAPQHKLMGNITLEILDLLKIKVLNFPTQAHEINETIESLYTFLSNGNSCCLIVKEKIKGNILNPRDKCLSVRSQNLLPYNENKSSNPLTRWEVLERAINFFPLETIYIATTGETSRELFELNDSDNNFYMVGSMGYASSIGLGISLYYNNRVIIFDGDGALLMHMGNMATIGHYAPSNLCHIVLNNKAHGTTGGQANSSETVNFTKIAQSCNYSVVLEANKDNILEVLELVEENKGPYFIHVDIDSSVKRFANRPQLTPETNARRLSYFIRDNLTQSY